MHRQLAAASLGRGVRPLDAGEGYCTVRATVPVAVVVPEVPVTVMV
jgi:hypothetical protein